jgi:hypothetical protein
MPDRKLNPGVGKIAFAHSIHHRISTYSSGYHKIDASKTLYVHAYMPQEHQDNVSQVVPY